MLLGNHANYGIGDVFQYQCLSRTVKKLNMFNYTNICGIFIVCILKGKTYFKGLLNVLHEQVLIASNVSHSFFMSMKKAIKNELRRQKLH